MAWAAAGRARRGAPVGAGWPGSPAEREDTAPASELGCDAGTERLGGARRVAVMR